MRAPRSALAAAVACALWLCPGKAFADVHGLALRGPEPLRAAFASALGLEARCALAWPIEGWTIYAGVEPQRLEAARALAAEPAFGALFASPLERAASGALRFATADLLLELGPQAAREALPGAERELDWAGMRGWLRLRAAAPDGWRAAELCAELVADGRARRAEPDWQFTGRSAGVPSDPLFAASWALDNHGQSGGALGIDLDALAAWSLCAGDPSVKVLVIDDGVQLDHPDLPWVSGADFTGQGGAGAPVQACDRHGTALAGCIAAAADNGIGGAGLAPAARVLSARALVASPACDGSWVSQASWTVDALAFGQAQGARISLNANSYGFSSAAIDQKYADTQLLGMAHFASSGDGGAAQLDYPASLANVLAVGAIDRTGALWPLSNTGLGLDLAAPGVAIPTTDRTGAAGYSAGADATLDGTSLAAAFAAAAAALALARRPSISVSALEQALLTSALDLGAPGPDTSFGAGLVRARAAQLAAAPGGATERETVNALGQQQVSDAYFPSISADARWVAFDSTAGNLVPGDTNGTVDGFVRDRLAGVVQRVSVSTAGAQANNNAGDVAISADGRAVAFDSLASNLVGGDANGTYDAFLRDLVADTTELLSLGDQGQQGNGPSFIPALSADARFAAFRSKASNLVPGDTNGADDIFVRDRLLATTVRASVSSAGQESNGLSSEPELSADGRWVSFYSIGSNLVANDTNGAADVFVRDLANGTTARVSLGAGGLQGNGGSSNPVISADGRVIAFQSDATNLVPGDTNASTDVFAVDLATGAIQRASVSSAGAQGNAKSELPCLSGDGRFVGFYSLASNLVAGDTNAAGDFFVFDRVSGQTTRESVSSSGAEGSGSGGGTIAALTYDGRIAVFESRLAGLVPNDTGNVNDVFLRDRLSAAPWIDLGFALPGAGGASALVGLGGFAPGASTRFELSHALPASFGALVLGVQGLYLPLFGGTLVGSPDFLKLVATDAAGAAALTLPWPAGLPSGLDGYAQFWGLDASAPQAFAASNALRARSF